MITLSQIRDAFQQFDHITLARGRDYAVEGRVQTVHLDDNRIVAAVKGTKKQPYSTSIRFDNKRIICQCTCNVGIDCKHAAAALFKSRERIEHLAALSRLSEPEINPVLDLPAVEEVINLPLPNEVKSWLEQLIRFNSAEEDTYPPDVTKRIFFMLDSPGSVQEPPHVSVVTVAPMQNRGYSIISRGKYNHTSDVARPEHVLAKDMVLINSLTSQKSPYTQKDCYDLKGEEGKRHLQLMIETGRFHFQDPNGPILRMGDPRKVDVQWKENKAGNQNVDVSIDGGGVLLWLNPLMYLDKNTGEIGDLDFQELSDPIVRHLIKAPKITIDTAQTVSNIIQRAFPYSPALSPKSVEPPKIIRATPIPHLIIQRELVTSRLGYGVPFTGSQYLPVASLEFEYGPMRVRHESPKTMLPSAQDGKPVQYVRDLEVEQGYSEQLKYVLWTVIGRGMEVVGRPKGNAYYLLEPMVWDLGNPLADPWSHFAASVVPELRKAGWKVSIDERLTVAKPVDIDTWTAKIDSSASNYWFDLSLDIEVEGQRIPLLPVLLSLLRRFTIEQLIEIPDKEPIRLDLDQTRALLVECGRVKPILLTLAELFDGRETTEEGLPISASELALLTQFETRVLEGALKWEDPSHAVELGKKLVDFHSITPVAAPEGLHAELRPYQSEGLAWMQFLFEYSFHGILADDMGLGKTVQTLAHILKEKELGRLKQPALIVAPTSTIPNWVAEAEKFVPSLKVCALHGPHRAKEFGKLGEYDIVLSTYPLLVRDREVLENQQFSIAVLDEAQYVKNSRASWTQVASQLKAGQRLCLSGTPMENHLGELWSLFTFLMPGFLGSERHFNERYRVPIEKHLDDKVRQELIRRIKPFLLRRTKEEVAQDLPPKTEIIERVELHDTQRDLYETVRTSVDERVRAELAAKGIARSTIVILDALLKLRQVCCDPRLVNLSIAEQVTHSAKRERLKVLLPEMVEEGRKILVFSQFTSMLALIQEDLKELGLPFVVLTGDTKDRKTPVETFQAGKVPIFLISLKAGGTGLNLTAADTVIHYDPWWNPAVENQATDRAHRIGQDKPVFVYKMIATGTVEEKIQELQKKKSELADALFEDRLESVSSLGAEDLNWILGPIADPD